MKPLKELNHKGAKAQSFYTRSLRFRVSAVKNFFLFLSVCLLPYQVHALASIDQPVVKLRSLDKTSARTSVFEVNVGSTVKFGEIYIKVQACRKAPEMEKPESAAFLQIWEVKPEVATNIEKPEWIFSGWMFASSPGLSSMDHPIYDVWVLDCLEKKGEGEPEVVNDEIKDGEGEIAKDAAPSEPEIEQPD
jgi:hypothetical protein